MVKDLASSLNSPLRYPGSKKRLVKYLKNITVLNNVKFSTVVEPFVGGGSVFLYFLTNNLAKSAIIADKDKLVYSFWRTLFRNPSRLIKFVKTTNIDLITFEKYKKIAKNFDKYSIEQLAEACLFLNRTSFSGVLTNQAGPIGGNLQKSKYKIDCRFNRRDIIKRIKLLSAYRDRVVVLNKDWTTAVSYAKKHFKSKDLLFYFDPPFYFKADRLYRNYFDKNEHENVALTISKINEPWILSYDNAPEIKKLYKKCRKSPSI